MQNAGPGAGIPKELLLLFADLCHDAGTGLSALIHSLGNLQHTAGAVASGIQAGYIGGHLFVHQNAVALGGGPQLLGQVGAACYATTGSSSLASCMAYSPLPSTATSLPR